MKFSVCVKVKEIDGELDLAMLSAPSLELESQIKPEAPMSDEIASS